MHGKRSRALSTARLLLVPALITLALTQLRLTDELLRTLTIGPVEIAWLVPVFGAYFAIRLARNQREVPRPGRLLLDTLVPLALFGAGLWLLRPTSGGMALVSIVAIALVRRPWPKLGNVLLGYALAARLPVVAMMIAATLGGWGTVYDVAPYGVFAGLLPQLTIWIAFTVVVGSLAASLALAFRDWLRDEPDPFGGSAATG